MRRLAWIALLLLLGWGALNSWKHRTQAQPPGVLAPGEPQQDDAGGGSTLRRGDTVLTTRAHFALTARVLSRENYHDADAGLAPLDLALGWGPMSDSSVLKDIRISQSGRFYWWHVDAFPIPRREIETHSANMHLIPADDDVRGALDRIRPGQLVHLEGFLVDASRADGWRWRTSMRRDDTGGGACELVYVERAERVAP